MLLILLWLYLYINLRKKKLDKFFEECKKENSSITNQIYNNELRSLSLVKHTKANEKSVEDAATMVYQIDKIKKDNLSLSISGDENNKKYQIFLANKFFIKIKNNNKSISEISNYFFETIGSILGNIKVIREEIIFVKKGLLEFKNKFIKNNLNKRSPNSYNLITKKFEEIGNKLGILDNLVNLSEMEKAILEFSNIKSDFLFLIMFANNCEELEKMIFTKLPNYLEKLKMLFSDTQKNTNCDLVFLGFQEQFNKFKVSHTSLLLNFNINEMENTKEDCEKLLISLSNLNNEINKEIDSYSFIIKEKHEINNYKNEISKSYLLLKDELKIAFQIDKSYFFEFDSGMEKLFQFLTEVDSWIKKNEADENNYNISFSSKRFKYKSLLYQLKGFYFLYVELKSKIELFYLEGESNLLKFERLSLLFRSMNSYIKKNYIILNTQEIENAKQINDIQQIIITIISNTKEGDAPLIVSEYKKNLSLVVKYIKTVGIKIEISKIFQKTLKLLASKRSSNIKFNNAIIFSENHYLDGNYGTALNKIIDTISKGIN